MIHVIGNAAIDTILHADRFPRPGETIVARELAEDLGGKGANQASSSRVAGKSASPRPSATTRPARGSESTLAAEGVETDGLRTWSGATDRCVIMRRPPWREYDCQSH